RIRGLCGWNPARPHWTDTFTLADMYYAVSSNREQEARQKAHRETTSDAQGRFYIRTHERLLTVPLEVTVGLHDSQFEFGTTRQMYPAVPADGFEQVLVFAPESKVLRGRVLNSKGEPIEAFQIRVIARGYEAELEYTEWYTKDRAKDWDEVERIRRMGSLSSQMTTDQDDGVILGPPFAPLSAFQFHGAGGTFEIGGYPPGEYNISVVADGYAERGLKAVDFPAEESLVVTLDLSSSISLRAEDFDGTPHGAFEVEVTGPMERVSGGYSLPLPVARTAMTSERGTIRLGGLESGAYKFKAAQSSFAANASTRKNLFLDPLIVEVEPGEQKRLAWSSYERGTLNGRFDWAGAPLNVLIEVDWKRRKGSNPSARVYSPGSKATVEADRFEVPDVRVGQYELKFIDAHTRQDLSYVLPPIRVEVPVGSATELEIQPVQPYRILKGQACIHGAPVITGFLKLESPESGLESTHIKLEGDGRFEVPLPESSRFTARLWAQLEKGSRDRWYVGSMDFSLGEGKPEPLMLNFVSPTLQLSFVDEDGDALPVHEAEAANFSLTRLSPGFTYRTGRSGKSEGEDIVFTHLAPGRYELLKRDTKAQFFWEPLPGSILTVTEQPIRQKQTVVLKHW
ncbi:MAG: carboxypeptidase-like regulatory domain-containing protein, partial [Planctomycetota bacterium]|nr:carboxypeptidase-like regulatory domain-containing protein [Planctomycetota bacterium]